MQFIRYKIKDYFAVDNQNKTISPACIEKSARQFGIIYSFESLDQIIYQRTQIITDEGIQISAKGLKNLVNIAKVSFVVVK